MAGWYEETYRDAVRLSVRVKQTLHSERSDFQLIEVLDTHLFGRVLVLDGLYMTSERDEYYYHEMIVHPPLSMVKTPKHVLVIGGGDGGTVREVLRHPEVESVTLVEIDGKVVELSQQYLGAIGTAWDDPRLTVRIEDGIKFAADAPTGAYDVVLLDGSDPVGPAEGLFDRSFYASIARILKPEGVFGLQSESPFLMSEVFKDVQATLRGFFGSVRPYLGPVPLYGASTWSWTVAAREPLDMNLERIARFGDDLKYLNADLALRLFALPNDVRRLIRG